MLKYFFILLLLAAPILGHAEDLPHDGTLRLYHSHSEEFLEITYERGGELIPEAMKKINHFMRSREEGAAIEMHPDLIRLLDHLQDHFHAHTIEIICGYRSSAFNKKLREEGRNVAQESYHMQGIATDIHIDEIPEDVLVKYLRQLNRGGVGYYPDLLMVHVDLGLKRFWQEAKFSARTNIGLFNKESPIELRTDDLFYFAGDKQKLKITQGAVEEIVGVELEWFHDSAWQQIWAGSSFFEGTQDISLTLNPLAKGAKAIVAAQSRKVEVALPYGKFRWKILTRNGRDQNSNEFYFKRKQ